jgi:hypothetical protein
MNRRQLLQRIAMLLGGAVSSPVVAAVLDDGILIPEDSSWRPRTLSAQQDRLVSAIAERIIPATDTPGASAALVDRFIDLMLTDWYDEEARNRFLHGLADLDASSSSAFGRPFLELSTEDQVSLLEPLDRDGVDARIEAARDVGSFSAPKLPFFAMMKEMTLVGYYTSQVGLLEGLEYEGFSGTFDACISLHQP